MRSKMKVNEDMLNEIASILAPLQPFFPEKYALFASAWNGLKHRFRSACDFDCSFTNSGLNPFSLDLNGRYEQERDLFCFFSCLLSAFECYFFAMYVAGSILKPKEFSISPEKLRNLYRKDISQKFCSEFKGHPLASAIKKTIDAPEFLQISDMRNYLSHRGGTPRTIHIGGQQNGQVTIPSNLKENPSCWNHEFIIDDQATRNYLLWADDVLEVLASKAKSFFENEIVPKIRRPISH